MVKGVLCIDVNDTMTTNEAPRQESDLYGKPVAEHVDGDECWEAYSSENPRVLFVAYYKMEGGEWVKQGLDRHNVDNLFNIVGWPTN